MYQTYQIIKTLEFKIGDKAMVTFSLAFQHLVVRVDWPQNIHFEIRLREMQLVGTNDQDLIAHLVYEARHAHMKEMKKLAEMVSKP